MEFTYLAQPPKRYTFAAPKLRKWIEGWCQGKVLNLFAGKTILNVDETRVDIDEEMPADYHLDARLFVGLLQYEKEHFDTVILDPPWNYRKAREKYEGRMIGRLTDLKNMLPLILHPKGRVISMGYSSVGMSKSRGFTKIALCLVCHGGDHNDAIGLVEEWQSPA